MSMIPEGVARTYFWVVAISVGAIIVLGGAALYAALVLRGAEVPGVIRDSVALVALALNFVVLSLIGRGQGKADQQIRGALEAYEGDREEYERRLADIDALVSRSLERQDETIREIVARVATEITAREVGERKRDLREVVREEMERVLK